MCLYVHMTPGLSPGLWLTLGTTALFVTGSLAASICVCVCARMRTPLPTHASVSFSHALTLCLGLIWVSHSETLCP